MSPLISSVMVQEGPAHDRVSVFNRGGLAGELVVTKGDGKRLSAILKPSTTTGDAALDEAIEALLRDCDLAADAPHPDIRTAPLLAEIHRMREDIREFVLAVDEAHTRTAPEKRDHTIHMAIKKWEDRSLCRRQEARRNSSSHRASGAFDVARPHRQGDRGHGG